MLISRHLVVSHNEAADRLSIHELVEAYAHCADRRDAKGQSVELATLTWQRGDVSQANLISGVLSAMARRQPW